MILTDNRAFFTYYFLLLTGRPPYPSQSALFSKMITGEVPDSLGLPTGAGKTSIIPIWLIALAWMSTDNPSARIGRRLVWVVNRRVVVDQATDEADGILTKVNELPENDQLRKALTTLSGGCPLAVSTLRGQRADNGDWKRNPATPAIVIGTVDMIGSRLLFRGYGNSRYWRSYDAALLGVDCLIVNDEAHLTPAFARLLMAIRQLQPAARTPYTFHVMLVSATERGLGDTPFQHSLQEDLAASTAFRRVYEAEKHLFLESVPDHQAATRRLVSLALDNPAPRTLVFVEQPEKALDVARQVKKVVGTGRVVLLTGTMRGHERDGLAKQEAFRVFQAQLAPAEPHFLIATSAAEVGVNLTSERLITMLAPLDHLLQRLGRLNRFGDQEGQPHVVGEAWVVFVEPKDTEAGTPLSVTLDYLRSLSPSSEGWRDICCRRLRENPAPREASEPAPPTAPLQRWRLDLWAQTSLPDTVVPPVEPWLHGKQDDEIPMTSVAWRAEVAWLSRDGVDPEDRRRSLENYAVLSGERVQEPAGRVKNKLSQIAESAGDTLGLLLTPDGEVEVKTISELATTELAYSVVLLPPGCGGLEHGMLTVSPSPDTVYDVADETGQGERRRYYVSIGDAGCQWTGVGSGDAPEAGPDPRKTKELLQFAKVRGLGAATIIEIPDTQSEDALASYLVLFAPKAANRPPRRDVPLDDHTSAAMHVAESLGGRLLASEVECFKEAARLHDQGKRHALWQRAMGGDPDKPKAKSAAAGSPRLLAGFRHELHSLVRTLPEPPCDLALHLVGSHHGWCRPHWEVRAYDPEDPALSERAALEGVRRFGRLQSEYGHWGLAYREAVFKAIDGLASAEPEYA